MFPKQPNQAAAIAGMGLASVNQTQASQFDIAESQFDIAEVQAALRCKLPGCDKPCTIESSGHVHDFCSRAHAVAYTNRKQEQNRFENDIKDPILSMMPIPDGMFIRNKVGKMCACLK